jgi:hypothetical protein
MKFFSWLRGNSRADDKLTIWRQSWQRAIDTSDHTDIPSLRRELDNAVPPDGDIEIELEMLEALQRLRDVQAAAAQGRLPSVQTQHRIVATEPCHFTAPASLPDDAAQTSGRVLITSTRAIFVGAGRTSTTAWHAIRDVVRVDRDVALVRADRTAAVQFRFNTFADALVAAFLAAHFKDVRRTRL